MEQYTSEGRGTEILFVVDNDDTPGVSLHVGNTVVC